MGGGDLNMKKSWHPLLIKNQERVWLEERKALAEKKKLDQLKKELEEERHMQELQRLQEEQTGKKRSEKMEWMYATPATGGSTNPNDLEDYLLGRKRVDKILTGDENAKVGAAHKNFIAVQNANSVRDTAAKIREDPLLAIKQQEQAAYQALLSNPLRFKAMKEKAGVKDKEKEKKKHSHRHRRGSDDGERPRPGSPGRAAEFPSRRSRQASNSYSRRSRSRTHSRTPPHHHSFSDYRYVRRSASPPRRYDSNRDHTGPSRGGHDNRTYRPQHSPTLPFHRDERNYHSSSGPPRSSSSYRRRHTLGHHPDHNANSRSEDRSQNQDQTIRPQVTTSAMSADADDRARRLAQMTVDADELNSSRAMRLAALKAAEDAEQAIEDEKRKKALKNGVQGDFMREQNKMVYGGSMGLEERLKRGRGALVRESD
ncbi:hypothetical protein BS47DRAFT_907355 [Hydnum rufescens UP504]|uniref:CBF1-interacting co-repressor CIR N-terminal domain-containing protein n=1 Tax=Hydnum rufescens UP504 TaxID=1448309 RepID=A0A9P6AXT9_9AGAM|nr:hypothetical protein BS47DRAFT_907355 [Hydnum rufescens UP504]